HRRHDPGGEGPAGGGEIGLAEDDQVGAAAMRHRSLDRWPGRRAPFHIAQPGPRRGLPENFLSAALGAGDFAQAPRDDLVGQHGGKRRGYGRDIVEVCADELRRKVAAKTDGDAEPTPALGTLVNVNEYAAIGHHDVWVVAWCDPRLVF